MGVAPEALLGEEQPIIERHFEYPTAGGEHPHLGVGPAFPQRGRQTDGPWFVVSDGAVFDRDAHRRERSGGVGHAREIRERFQRGVLPRDHPAQGIEREL